MLRNTLIAIIAVSALAPLALVPTGASAGYNPPRSVIPTFHRSTIQQPRPTHTSPRGNTSPYRQYH